MNVRVNDFYLPSQISVEKTPTFMLVAGAISVIVGLVLFREISYGFCGAGVLAMAISRLSPHRFKTRVTLGVISSIAFCVAIIASVAFFKNIWLDSQTASLLAFSAGALGTLALLQAKGHKVTLVAAFILAAVSAVFLATNRVLDFESAKALTIAFGSVFAFSASIVLLQRKKRAEEIMESLEQASKIEVDEPYAYACFQEWLLKQNCDGRLLEGKNVVYTGFGVNFPFKAPEKVKGETTLEEDSQGFALPYGQSHGHSVEESNALIEATLRGGDHCLTVKAGGKTVGGAFYRYFERGPTLIHTISRLPHLSGTKVIKKVVTFLKSQGRPLWLQVYKDNPAFDLYKKEGFSVISSDFDYNGPFYNMIYQT